MSEVNASYVCTCSDNGSRKSRKTLSYSDGRKKIIAHYACGAVFFYIQRNSHTYMQSKKCDRERKRKRKRTNRIYKICINIEICVVVRSRAVRAWITRVALATIAHNETNNADVALAALIHICNMHMQSTYKYKDMRAVDIGSQMRAINLFIFSMQVACVVCLCVCTLVFFIRFVGALYTN